MGSGGSNPELLALICSPGAACQFPLAVRACRPGAVFPVLDLLCIMGSGGSKPELL
eukprot:CAMPEP_0197667330 /NCGR_PEP_ID=MMETSP1338-20131121/65938_1 /TAXON_ID=43686 ORGANISM="Pelagodinium beii, Strain RCC1491" /NCGR_SAMPLE_ID=MMETSP1338 /ASSEMBLY_ACC=CAM_ASM_000754 /LENGTH=55 /DNA_ID=CAMNT_0043246547 /DNA_START=42 /DNA_END=206 /DNA_ORIENTATION=+